MMITFAVRVSEGGDVDAAAEELLAEAQQWVFLSVISGTFDPMPVMVTGRTPVPAWVSTGEMTQHGLERIPLLRLAVETLIEVKVEVNT